MTKSEHLPLARKEELLIERLSDEVLVYDLARKKAHCLNQAAALIWDHCDGKTSVAEMAGILSVSLNAPVDEELVWFGLREIGRKHLLEEPVMMPGLELKASRRELIRKIGLAISVPLVVSVLAPKASAINSGCLNRFCASNADCITGCPTCNIPTSTCT
jgi:coenzyme PQQ synthesis protein D (PqqD)